MSLPDFVKGVKLIPRLLAEEALVDIEIATAGGMVDEKYIRGLFEKYHRLTMDPEVLAQLEKHRSKWAGRGYKISI